MRSTEALTDTELASLRSDPWLDRQDEKVRQVVRDLIATIDDLQQHVPSSSLGAPRAEVMDDHAAAARAYDSTPKPIYSWAPVWDGTSFSLHAYPPSSSVFDHDDRPTTLCGMNAPFPKTYMTSGHEPRCNRCWDASLFSLASAFAAYGAQIRRQLEVERRTSETERT